MEEYMKNLLNSVLALSLLVPAVSMFANDVTVAEIADVAVDAYMVDSVSPVAQEEDTFAQYLETVNRGSVNDMIAQYDGVELHTADAMPDVTSDMNKAYAASKPGIERNVKALQQANKAALEKASRQNIFVRGYNATKSAVTSAGSYVAGKVKGAGSYVANTRLAGYLVAGKNRVASEWNDAKGVKGVSLFAAKAVVGTSVVAGSAYLMFKAGQYAFNKGKAYMNSLKSKSAKKAVATKKRKKVARQA